MKNILIGISLALIMMFMLFNIFRNKNETDYDNKYEAILKELNKYKWDDFNTVKSMVQPAVEIISNQSNNIPVGTSKIGGTPDLPSVLAWPTFEGKSMLFFAQINLAEISSYHRNEYLPKNGIIYFFAYFPEPENEFGAAYEFLKDKKEYKILFYDGEISELKNTTFPDDIIPDYQFPSSQTSFRTFFQLPPSMETGIIESSTLSERDKESIQQYNDQFSDGLIDQVLGIPTPLQYGADFDLAVSYLNLDYSEYEKRKAEIDKIRPDFINLLSLPIFDRIGDSQMYFGIQNDDLKNKRFDKAILILQGT